jgi:hypothetical protein
MKTLLFSVPTASGSSFDDDMFFLFFFHQRRMCKPLFWLRLRRKHCFILLSQAAFCFPDYVSLPLPPLPRLFYFRERLCQQMDSPCEMRFCRLLRAHPSDEASAVICLHPKALRSFCSTVVPSVYIPAFVHFPTPLAYCTHHSVILIDLALVMYYCCNCCTTYHSLTQPPQTQMPSIHS